MPASRRTSRTTDNGGSAQKVHRQRRWAGCVIGPDGTPLTLAGLPAKDTKRWVIRYKAEVVAAVRGGLLSVDDACMRYDLTLEEYLSWQRSIDRYGLAGLRATRARRSF